MIAPPLPPSRVSREKRTFIPDWRLFFKTRWKVIGFCLIGVLLLEVFVFNLPTWQTVRAVPSVYSISSLHTGAIKEQADGIVTTASDATVNVTSEKIIKYLYFEVPSKYENSSHIVNYSVGISYSGDKYIHYGSAMTMDLGVKDDRYINAGSYVHNVTIQFNVPKETFIPVTGVVVNPKIPYRFSILRLLMLLLLASFWIFLGPGSVLWKMELDTGKAFHFLLLCFATLGVMFFYFVTWYFNGNSYQWDQIIKIPNGLWISYNQYGNLANSLLHGHTYLNLPISPGLKALKNPYSLAARLAIGKNGQVAYWDHAFYHDKYYCYFGVIPAIIFFMPYEIITGKEMLSGWAILIALLIAIVFATFLVVRIAKLYFEDASFGTVLCAIWMLGMGCGLLQEAFVADFYSVPQASSYMFTVISLWCWLKAIKKKRNKRGKYVSPWWIFFGSLFMACNLGCRPPFIIFSLLAVPIFWTSVFKDRTLFSRKGLLATIFAILPFFLIFIPLFIYNFDRFGSAFNFGQNYNLTELDLTRAKRPNILFLISEVLICFWFKPAVIRATFPFISQSNITTPLYYPRDPFVGGGYFVFTAPFVLLLFIIAPYVFRRRKRGELDNRTVSKKYWPAKSVRGTVIATMSLSFALAVCSTFLNAYLGGCSQRYEACFGTLFTLSSILVLFCALPRWVCCEREKQGSVVLLKISLVALIVASLVLEFLGLCDLGRLGQNSTVHLFKVASWFLFVN